MNLLVYILLFLIYQLPQITFAQEVIPYREDSIFQLVIYVLIVSILSLVFSLCMLLDLCFHPRENSEFWLAGIIIFPPIGALLYYFFVKRKDPTNLLDKEINNHIEIHNRSRKKLIKESHS